MIHQCSGLIADSNCNLNFNGKHVDKSKQKHKIVCKLQNCLNLLLVY